MWWESFCPTCGLTRSRWAGCTDAFHVRDAHGRIIDNTYGQRPRRGTPVRVRISSDIDDPGDAANVPGSGKEPLGGPLHA